MKRLFSLLLAVCICLFAGAAPAEDTVQAEGVTGPYQWLDCELTVDSIRVAPGGDLFSGPMRGTRFIKQDNRVLSQIRELKQLLDEGAISKEEFELLKKKIL